MSFFTAKVRLWPILLACVIVIAAAIASFVLGAVSVPAFASVFGNNSQSHDVQVIESFERQEEVALVSLGIQGIERGTDAGQVLGVTVPGADRLTLIQYTFQAKLGVDGKRVRIESNGDGTFYVTVPEFSFIGYDQPEFEDPIRQNGALSFLTPEVNEPAMINSILSEDAQQEYLRQYADLLKEQTKSYYTNIATSIDPDAKLKFEFAQ
jgi:hypothetical protein